MLPPGVVPAAAQEGEAHPPTASNATSGSSNPEFADVFVFLFVTIFVGAVVNGMAPKRLLKKFPQPIVMMVLSMVVGVAMQVLLPDMSPQIDAVVDPTAIQVIFLPILMFTELFTLNTRAFFVCFWQLVWLIGPGVLIGSALIGLYPLYMMPSPKFSAYLSFAFGGMLSTTDPIAVIMVINELAAPKRLAAVTGGESLLNDGVSIILVDLFLHLNSHDDAIDASTIVLFCFNQLLFSWLFGTGMAIIVLLLLRILRSDTNTVVALCVGTPFLTFAIATYYMKSSGVLAIIPVGILLNEFGRGLIVEHVEHVEHYCETLSFTAMTWLYSLTGFVCGVSLASNEISGVDWGSMFALYLWINVVRFAMVIGSLPVLRNLGYGFTFKEAVLLSWGGLRGAVGLTLALQIKRDHSVSTHDGAVIQFFMSGMVMLMLFNGVTTSKVLKALQLHTKPNERLIEALKQKMSEKCLETFEGAGISRFRARELAYGEMVRSAASQRIPLNMRVRDEKSHVHMLTNEEISPSILKEQRRHLVLAQRLIYEKLLRRNLINRPAWKHLDRAADKQLEENDKPLNQFAFLLAFVRRGIWKYKFLHKGWYDGSVEAQLLDCLLSQKLEKADLARTITVPAVQSMAMSTSMSSAGRTDMRAGDSEGAAANATAGTRSRPPSHASEKYEDFDHQTHSTTTTNGVAARNNKNNHNKHVSLGTAQNETTNGAVDGGGIMRNSAPGTTSEDGTTTNKEGSYDDENEDDARSADFEDEVDNSWFPGLKDRKRKLEVNLTPYVWLVNLTFASWGYIVTQQQSDITIDEMFQVSDDFSAFTEERNALKKEIQATMNVPALFLDAVARYCPKIIVEVKKTHVISQASDRLFGSLAQMSAHGLLERMDLKRLHIHAEQTLRRVRDYQTLRMSPPATVGRNALLLRDNPNYFPFYSRAGTKDKFVSKKSPARRHSLNDFRTERDFEEEEGIWTRPKSVLVGDAGGVPGGFGANQPTGAPSMRGSVRGTMTSRRGTSATSTRRGPGGMDATRRFVVDRRNEFDMQRLMETMQFEDSDLKKF